MRQISKQIHDFRVSTMDMVENTLKNMNESLITIANLKKTLPKQVNHNTLLDILDRLQENNRIYVSAKGITYTYNPSPKFTEAMKKGFAWEDLKDFRKKHGSSY